MIVRFAKGLVRRTPLPALFARAKQRLRTSALLLEEFLPHDEHAFDRDTWVLKETRSGVRLWCSLDERAISRPILLNTYERAETRFIERSVRTGDLVVDAGANLGYHALHMAKLVGELGCVEAFEPLPYLADALEASIVENGFGARVRAHRRALDTTAGALPLRHAPRTANFGGAHFAPPGALPPAHADEIVRSVRLDDVVAGRRCRFIKMDVEGAEPRVVRGALETLASGLPIVLAELHDAQLRLVSACGTGDFIAQMAALGYSCSRLSDDGTRGHAIHRYEDLAPINVIFDRRAASDA